jgi:hypothetical protein
MHESIVNVLTNVNLVQTILCQLLYDNSSIAIFLKRKLDYKSIYMLGYVHSNIMIKALQELCQTPLYESVKIAIRPNLQDLVELDEIKGLGEKQFDANLETKKLDIFKEVVKMKIA